jgi:Trypsin
MIGGTAAAQGDIPGMLGLTYENANYGGAILIRRDDLNRAVALTAAHCLNYDLNKVTVRGGSLKWHTGGKVAKVKEYFVHPDYALPTGIDLAILVLDDALQGVPLALMRATEEALYQPGSNVTMAGWGPPGINGTNPDLLQALTIPLVTPGSCDKEGRASNAAFACCNSGNNMKSTPGDSGGPMIGGSQEARRLLGVIEGGKGGNSIATRVDKQALWIDNPPHVHSYVVDSGPTAIAIVPANGRKFITHSGLGTVSVFDAGWTLLGKPVLGEGLRAIAGSPTGPNVYVAGGGVVNAIDSVTYQVTASFKVTGIPSALAIAPDGRFLFVSHGKSVTVLDTVKLDKVNTFDLGVESSAMAVAPDGKRIYAIKEGDIGVKVLDVSASSVESWEGNDYGNTCIAATADCVYIGTNDTEVSVWGSKGNRLGDIQLRTSHQVKSLAMSGTELCVGYETNDSTPSQNGVEVFDTSDENKPLRTRQLGRGPLASLTPLSAGGVLAVNGFISSISVVNG